LRTAVNAGGFFTLVLQPPDKFASEDRTPKEIVFRSRHKRLNVGISDRESERRR
jgi:hypothetical protein